MPRDHKRRPAYRTVVDEAEQLFFDGQRPDGIRLLEESLNQNPSEVKSWEIQGALGELYSLEGCNQEAIELLKSAAVAVPCDDHPEWAFDIMSTLAAALLHVERFQESLEWFERAKTHYGLISGPEFATDRFVFHAGKGDALLMLKRNTEALVEYRSARSALVEDSSSTVAALALIDTSIAAATLYSGDRLGAFQILKGLDTSGYPPAQLRTFYYLKGKVHYGLEENVECLSNFRSLELIGLDEVCAAEVYCLMASAHFRLDEIEEAMKYLELSLAHPPSHPWIEHNNRQLQRAIEERRRFS